MTNNTNHIPEHIPASLHEVFARNAHPYLMWDGIEQISAAMEEVFAPFSQEAIKAAAQVIAENDVLHMIGCGTSYFAATASTYAFHALANLPAIAYEAFEYLAYPLPFSAGNTLIGISHTGTTPVVVDAVDMHNGKGGDTIGITDVADSFLADSAKHVIAGTMGKEPALPKTRSYLGTLLRLLSLAEEVGRLRGTLAPELAGVLAKTPKLAQQVIEENLAQIREIVAAIPKEERIIITAGGPNYATAIEGALKLTEATQTHAQAWEIEEAAHGTWASTDPGDWIIFVAVDGPSLEKTKSIYTGLRVIGVNTWVITDCPDKFPDANFVTTIPGGLPELYSPLLAVIPLYLFTYETALAKGIDPDVMRLDDPRYLEARTGMRPTKKTS